MRVFTRRSLSAVIVCVLVAATGAVVWWRLDSGEAPSRAEERSRYFDVPTGTWEVGTAAKQAGLSGTLRFTADGCPFVDSGAHLRMWVTMPAGARGITVDGVRSIVDPADLVYGTEDEEVVWGGAGGSGGSGGRNHCAPPDGHGFDVQIAPELRRIDGTPANPDPPKELLGNPPCQRSDDPPDDVEHFDTSAVGLRFDRAMRTYTSYAASVWHAGGGVRVRIAADRSDTEVARAEAERIIATLPTEYRHAVKINETTVSLDDLREWAADAKDGLTHLPAENIIGRSTDVLCISVDLSVRAYSEVRLTDQERTRYKVRGFQLTTPP